MNSNYCKLVCILIYKNNAIIYLHRNITIIIIICILIIKCLVCDLIPCLISSL